MYIFGYGSLISGDSRRRTGRSGASFPVKVSGLQRRWGAQIDMPPSLQVHRQIPSFSAVSVTDERGAGFWTNGVLVQIDAEELQKFDEREIGYERIKIDTGRVQLYGAGASDAPVLAGSDVWCYVMPANVPQSAPSPTYPICQTYLDVILQGCDEISPEFTRDFLKTTTDWGSTAGGYIDDRAHPGYPRYDAEASGESNAKKFDGLMGQLQGSTLATRVQGPGADVPPGPTPVTRPPDAENKDEMHDARVRKSHTEGNSGPSNSRAFSAVRTQLSTHSEFTGDTAFSHVALRLHRSQRSGRASSHSDESSPHRENQWISTVTAGIILLLLPVVASFVSRRKK